MMASQVERQNNLLSDCISSLNLYKEFIDKYLEGPEKDEELSHLEEIVKDYCLIEFNAAKTSEACQEVVDYFNDERVDRNVDVENLYKDTLSAKQETFSGNFQQEKIWKQVMTGTVDHDVEEVEQRNRVEDTEYEEMQDSIYYSNVFTPPVDPISKMVVKDPYKNRTCGHVYDYKFILQYIKAMKNKAKCPYIGCSNRNISLRELVQDHETKEKIANYQKNTENMDVQSDNSEEES